MRNIGQRFGRVRWWMWILVAIVLAIGVAWVMLCRDHRPSMSSEKPKGRFPSLASDGVLQNPYRLTTEETFAADYQDRIMRCFDSARVDELSVPATSDARSRNPTIRYKQFPATAAKKGAIFIVSGRTEGMVIYPELIYDLRKQGYTVYIHDHRGQGFSGRLLEDPQKSHVESFEDYVRDLKVFFDDRVKKNEKDNPNRFILAHSMGGAVAVRYIEEHPDDFKAAVLVTPMNAPDTSPVPISLVRPSNYLLAACCKDKYAFTQEGYKRQPFAETRLTHSRVRWEQSRDNYDAPNEKARIGGTTHQWVRASIRAGLDTRTDENVDRIRIPILLFQAGADVAVRNDAQEEFCRKVNARVAGRCVAYSVDQAYHALFIEADAYRIPVLTKTLDFLKTYSANVPAPAGNGDCEMPALNSGSAPAQAAQSPAQQAPPS